MGERVVSGLTIRRTAATGQIFSRLRPRQIAASPPLKRFARIRVHSLFKSLTAKRRV